MLSMEDLASGVHVLGAARSGSSAARYLSSLKVPFSLSEERDSEALSALAEETGPAAVFQGRLSDDGQAKIWVVSPGISPFHPELVSAVSRGVRLISDLDLWMLHFRTLKTPPKLIGVTGTNGKGYVLSLLSHLLSGVAQVELIGNIGLAALSRLPEEGKVYLLELSSFQLYYSEALPLSAAALLEVSDDHLDWHRTRAHYLESKFKIAQEARAFVGLKGARKPPVLPEETYEVSLSVPSHAREFGLSDGELCEGRTPLLSASALPIFADHDILNTLFVFALLRASGFDPSALAPLAASFKGLPHRMTLVSGGAGAAWIDNSKATNVSSAAASILSVGRRFKRVFVLMGGEGKGQDFSPLREAFLGAPNVSAVLYGKDRLKIRAAIPEAQVLGEEADLTAAVGRVAPVLSEGDALLLAPACASLDQFKDYQARGELFCTLYEQYAKDRRAP